MKWIIFIGIILTILMLDLGVFNKKDHVIGVRESLYLSGFYIVLGLLFGIWVYFYSGAERAGEYYTGFLVEKTLSLDNIFVISLIFKHLQIPPIYQHRVLFWGILGVIVLRGIMIGLGAALVTQFAWVLYIFAVLLIYTGFKMLLHKEDVVDIEHSRMFVFLQKHLRTTTQYNGHDFFMKQVDPKTNQIKTYATPLFVALAMIELVDLIFAVDSVPAIFTITTDPYVVYTSNIFAILGLRALFFALEAVLQRFKYLKFALALVLIFIGGKIFIADLMGWEKFPASVSLGVTVGLIFSGIFYSLYKTRKTA